MAWLCVKKLVLKIKKTILLAHTIHTSVPNPFSLSLSNATTTITITSTNHHHYHLPPPPQNTTYHNHFRWSSSYGESETTLKGGNDGWVQIFGEIVLQSWLVTVMFFLPSLSLGFVVQI
ncbi:hypothetical protein Hanom_Chr07g00668441 [Helianthus anomalus]